MRPSLVVLTLIAVAGCGGGGDAVRPPESFRVTFVGAGTGAGSVRATQGSTFNCPIGGGNSCDATIEDGTALTFEATADANSVFTAWHGDVVGCAAATSCSITVDRNFNIVVVFAAAPYPAVAGAYNVSGTFDGLPPTAAFFNGTVTLTQASRTSGELGGSAVLLTTIGSQVFNISDPLLSPANVSPLGVIAFTMAGGTATWTFTGTLSGTNIVNGRHSLSSPGTTASSGPWTGTRTSGLRELTAQGPNQLGELRARLQR